MADSVVKGAAGFSVRAFEGDAKTLLAFDMPQELSTNLAGFTIAVDPPGQPAYFIENNLRYATPGEHAQDPAQPANSSVNAPLHKFRWVHVPGAVTGADPTFGTYAYTVTPRFADGAKQLLPLDPGAGVTSHVSVAPFSTGKLHAAFTRGYVQSQAYVNRFGPKPRFRPAGKDLLFDTSAQAGIDPAGRPFTFAEEYDWLGATARRRILDLLEEVRDNPALHLDMLAYDLDEPDVCGILLGLAAQGRIRVVVDDSRLHSAAPGKPPESEDVFEQKFEQAAAGTHAAILRGRFGRYAHDKILIVSDAAGPIKVLTGSTNFSVTGLYVNANHVLVFQDSDTPRRYQGLFDEIWAHRANRAAFVTTALSTVGVSVGPGDVPATDISFAPHDKATALKILGDIGVRISAEATRPLGGGSVLFAVMQTTGSDSPVYTALNALHADTSVFSYGISDSPAGIYLYEPRHTTGVLVTGRPKATQLPPPFSQVPGIGSDHQIHHKFVVCGFREDDAVVYCGSSNLATGGEQLNGDNLLAIHDRDVAAAFAIEAVTLVDHFQFLDRYSASAPAAGPAPPPADPQAAASTVGWNLSVGAGWARKYFDPTDLYSIDRRLFA